VRVLARNGGPLAEESNGQDDLLALVKAAAYYYKQFYGAGIQKCGREV
jgi:hypothetical protein